jgi:molecular chaperone GrpE
VERDLDELTARAEKADHYLELAQRTKADFENYKRRAVRDASLAQDRGVARLAKELLPAIDSLIRAVQAAETFAEGSPEEAAVTTT